MTHSKIVKRVNPNASYYKEKFFSSFFLLYLQEMMGISWNSYGNYIKIYVNQTIMLYILNVYSDESQLFLNKTRKKNTKNPSQTYIGKE